LAGYRPIGLSSAGDSTIISQRATYADRRRAAAERLSRTADITQRLDAAVAVSPGGSPSGSPDDPVPIDPDGTLRACVRVLLPFAYRSCGFDVTVSLGPGHEWAARIHHGPDGVTVGLERGSGHDPASDQDVGLEGTVAVELAALLWSRAVCSR
jgi:sugar phosphate isomerase/epimerase